MSNFSYYYYSPSSRFKLFTTCLIMLIFQHSFLISLVSSKNATFESSYIQTNNSKGEYIYGEFHHVHISNPPLYLPNTTIQNGVLRGIIITEDSGRDVYAFLGVPFAKPPIGPLRFQPPVSIDNWTTPYYDAVSLPPTCSQKASESFPEFRGETMWNPNTIISEDCLYLNIWVPASIFNKTKLGKNETNESESDYASVMFWIYGGGFNSGSSTLDVYNGSKLADKNDVIVVSCQYRLGPFGFLYFGNKYAPGNVGLLDQNLALRWIHSNIRAFGGNPELITMFGESAGAACVSYHLLSPLSQPYIKRAILMSGTLLSPWAFQTPQAAMDYSFDLAKRVGCGSRIEGKPFIKIIECLQQADSQQLIDKQFEQTIKFVRFPFVPTVDGTFIQDLPRNLLKRKTTKQIDIIMGNDQDEGAYFIQYGFVLNNSSTPEYDYNHFKTNMEVIFQDSPPCQKNAIFNYYTNWINPTDGNQNRIKLIEAAGDNLLICPSRAFANEWAASPGGNNKNNNVFYYFFTQRTSTNPWGEWMGVIHGDEIEYLFGFPIPNVTHTKEEMELAGHMMQLFTNFSKTGIPSPNWKTYSEQTPVYLNLNATIISDQVQDNLFGPRAETCGFWNYQLPNL